MTVLTIILIILFFCIMSMVEKIQGTARVVNYAGLVRGKTQRIIKLEDAGEPQDTMIADINAYIDGLQNGSSELDLVRLDAHVVSAQVVICRSGDKQHVTRRGDHRDVAGGCHRGHRSRETFRYGEECR